MTNVSPVERKYRSAFDYKKKTEKMYKESDFGRKTKRENEEEEEIVEESSIEHFYRDIFERNEIIEKDFHDFSFYLYNTKEIIISNEDMTYCVKIFEFLLNNPDFDSILNLTLKSIASLTQNKIFTISNKSLGCLSSLIHNAFIRQGKETNYFDILCDFSGNAFLSFPIFSIQELLSFGTPIDYLLKYLKEMIKTMENEVEEAILIAMNAIRDGNFISLATDLILECVKTNTDSSFNIVKNNYDLLLSNFDESVQMMSYFLLCNNYRLPHTEEVAKIIIEHDYSNKEDITEAIFLLQIIALQASKEKDSDTYHEMGQEIVTFLLGFIGSGVFNIRKLAFSSLLDIFLSNLFDFNELIDIIGEISPLVGSFNDISILKKFFSLVLFILQRGNEETKESISKIFASIDLDELIDLAVENGIEESYIEEIKSFIDP